MDEADERVRDLKMTVICPDKSEITASRRVNIHGRFPLDVTPALKTAAEMLNEGALVDAEYKVENKGVKDLDAVELDVKLPGLVVTDARIARGSAECSKLGTSASCSFALPAEGSVVIKLVFKIPEGSGGIEFKSDATVRIKGQTSPAERKVDKQIAFTANIPPN
jgi:hypothetical protein